MINDRDERLGFIGTVVMIIATVLSIMVMLIEPLIYVIGAVALVAILCKLTNC